MAGAKAKFRHLSRSSAHRQAMLRNMVESLIEKEQIQTTYAKAKECQRMAEKVITLGKKNTIASRNRATQILYRPKVLLPKLFGELRERYATREGGYTRVLLIESPKEDQARSAILELVDGPKDMRYNLTARTMAKDIREGSTHSDITNLNIAKVTRFRKDGMEELKNLAEKLVIDADPETEERKIQVPEKKKVYPEPTLVFGKDRLKYGLAWASRKSLQGSKMQHKPTTW